MLPGYDAVVLDWMDHYLRGVDNGVGRGKPVRYYEMGAEAWRESVSWPPPAQRTAYLLAAAKPGRPGRISPELHGGPTWSAFVADPGHPVRSPVDDPGRGDYRALADRKDLLTFDSAPLARDLEVTGAVDADLFASCDCRDFDLWARLYDVTPEGAAVNLMSLYLAGKKGLRHGHGIWHLFTLAGSGCHYVALLLFVT